MNTSSRVETYVDEATAGLGDDPELRLDVRAELAAHIEDAVRERAAEGEGGADALEHALAAMGPVAEVAGALLYANRARMRWRAHLRMALRWLLVPAAVVTALLSVAGLRPAAGMASLSGMLNFAWSGRGQAVGRLTDAWDRFLLNRRLTDDQQLVMWGDAGRTNSFDVQRAIWEAHPANPVYAHNYLSHLASGYGGMGETPQDNYARFEPEVRKILAVDSANARCHYLLAAKLLQTAGKVEQEPLGVGPDGKSNYTYRLDVADRARLDQAMKELQAGLAKPVFRRYGREMVGQRLTILGSPRRLADQVQQIGMAAGILMPDLADVRKLARASVAYARLLQSEGRGAEAAPFADAWEQLARHLNGDAFTLIDVLVVGAIARMGESSAAFYDAAGRAAQAAETRRRSAALNAPVRAWNEKRNRVVPVDVESLVKQRGSVLTALLLPAVGEVPAEEEFAPARLLDYVMLDRSWMVFLLCLLTALMLSSAVVALRWRFIPGASAAPVLLLPRGRRLAVLLALAVALPLVVFWVYTRWLPFGGREFGVGVALPKAMCEVGLTLVCVVGLLVTLAVRDVCVRCFALGVPVPRRGWMSAFSRGWLLAAGGLLAVGSLLPAQWGEGRSAQVPWLMAGVGLTGFAVLAGWFLSVLFGRRRHGLFYGTVARSLIPVFAAAIIVLRLLSGPYLDAQERALVRSDKIVAMDPAKPGLTAIETRVMERLREAFDRAAAALPDPGAGPDTARGR